MNHLLVKIANHLSFNDAERTIMKSMMCMFRFVLSLVLILGFYSVQGQTLPEQFAKDSKGRIHVMGIAITPAHYDKQWHAARYQPGDGFFNHDNVVEGGWQFDGVLNTAGNIPLILKHTIHTDTQMSCLDWEIIASATSPIATNGLSLNLDLPVPNYAGRTLHIDGKPITLTSQASDQSQIFPLSNDVQQIEIPGEKGTLTLKGRWTVELVDRRRWKSNVYTLRLYFDPGRGMIERAALSVKMLAENYSCYPLSIAAACNMGFEDQQDGDGKGGWSDQGPTNDLSALKPGLLINSGIVTNIIDPAENNGKSCMVFGAGMRPYFLKQATIPVPIDSQAKNARTLFVLHTTAWGNHAGTKEPIGNIKAYYKDGTTTDYPVMMGRELGDWWGANSKPNGKVVWAAPNGRAYVGLYLSRFELPQGKTLDHFDILSNNRCVWGIFAMTLSAEDIPLPSDNNTPLIVTEGKDWKSLSWSHDIEPGSILDFTSQYSQEPVGKWGRVVVRDSHFEFENRPGIPVKFHGVNVGFGACFMEHAQSEQLARQLRMLGYNILRLDHFDRELLDAHAADSHTLDPGKFERFCYFIAQLKKEGIYVTWDLYFFRDFRAEDSVLNRPYFREIKPLILVDALARKALTEFARVFLTTVNPYTQMPLSIDPVLATTSTMNEDFLLVNTRTYPDVTHLQHQAYEKWLASHNLDKNASTSSPLFTRFIYESAVLAHRSLQNSLRQIGLRTPFTANNTERLMASNLLYDAFDYVDNHFYHDHPTFVGKGWTVPYAFSCASSVKLNASTLRSVFPTRRFDKAFTITEYSHVMPNPYRAEGGPLVGGYAAFQDWDMLCRFYYGGQFVEQVLAPARMEKFAIVNDPMNIMAERIINLLFRRGDVAAAQKRIAYVLEPEQVFTPGMDLSTHSSTYSELGLLTGVGTITPKALSAKSPSGCVALVGDEKTAPMTDQINLPYLRADSSLLVKLIEKGIISSSQVDLKNSSYTSDTGQLKINSRSGWFHVQTPRSQAIVLTDKGSHVTDLLSVENASGPVTVFVTAMDQQTISLSKRILLLHLTDARNTQMKFRDQDGRIMEDWGNLPLLVKIGTAKISLKLQSPGKYKVFAVDLSGRRMESVQTSVTTDGQLSFEADTFGIKQGVLAYELIYE